MKVDRALVTGGAGFIGSHIVDALLERGVDVWVLDDLSTGRIENLGAHRSDRSLTFVRGDVRRPGGLDGLPDRVDVVFHEAAIASVPKSVDDPRTVHDVNVNGTIEVLELALALAAKRFVFASSAAVYGPLKNEPADEEGRCFPSSPYGASKLAVEDYLQAYHSTYGLQTVALRYFNVYGPRQRMNDDYSGVIPLFARQLLASETPTIFGDGLQTRDFVHVTDVAAANLLAMESANAPGRVFNVATGSEVTILHLFEVIARATGREGTSPRFGPVRKGDLRKGTASTRRAQDYLGYSPKTKFEDGIQEVVDHVRTQLHERVAAR